MGPERNEPTAPPTRRSLREAERRAAAQASGTSTSSAVLTPPGIPVTPAPRPTGPTLPSWSQVRDDATVARSSLPAPGAPTSLPAPGARVSSPASRGHAAAGTPDPRTTPPSPAARAASAHGTRSSALTAPGAQHVTDRPAPANPSRTPHAGARLDDVARRTSFVHPAAPTTHPAGRPAPAARTATPDRAATTTRSTPDRPAAPGVAAADGAETSLASWPTARWTAGATAPRSAVETTVMAPLALDDESAPVAAVSPAAATAHAEPAGPDPVVAPTPSRARSAARTARTDEASPDHRAARMPRLAVRLGVLGALAGVTVVIPTLSDGGLDGVALPGTDAALAESSLPDTVSALTASSLSILPPSSLVSADGALAAREAIGSSRTEVRSALAGCDGSQRAAGENGLLKTADLCTLWDAHTQLRADAAVSLAEFNQAFVARFGADLCLSSGYRSLAQQRAVKAQKGGLAAAPGKSNHGWGLAVDLCSSQTSGAKWAWILDNGPTFGWENPGWAKRGGSGPFEPWHWEYSKGVKEDGEYYDG